MHPSRLLRLTTLLLPLPFLFAAPAAAADEGDDQYRLLAGLAEKEMHDMVVKEGEAFLRRFGDHPKRDLARYRLASSLFELDRRRDAAPHFRELSRRSRFEYRAESWFRLGQCELDAGNHAEARRAFESVIDSGKDYLLEHARFLLGDCAFRSGDYAAAEEAYREALRASPRGDYARDASSGLAWCAWKLGKHELAARRIEEHLGKYGGGDDPYVPELTILLGEAHLMNGEPKKALEAYRSVTKGAQHEAALRGAAFALADLGDHAGAAREFGRLLERYPEGEFAGEAALHRGIHLLRSGDANGALAALNAPAAGKGAEVLYWRAQAQAKTGDAKGALATLDRALRGEPGDEIEARIHMLRGDLLSETGREDEAVEAYGRAGSDYALHAAAVAALNGGEPSEAARLGNELLKRFPQSEYGERTRVVVGEAHFAQGDYAAAEKALAGLERTAKDESLRARVLSRLGWCRYLAGDAAGAATRFASLVREHPNAPEAEESLYMEGRAREDAGEDGDAVRAWKRYLKAYPSGDSREEVLVALARHEDLEGATRRVETLMNEHEKSDLLPQALYDLGERASAEGNLPTAKACYEELVKRAPDDPLATPARYGLGWCLVQQGEFQAAAEHLNAMRADFGAPAELRASGLELLVWAWRKAGEPDKSAEAWRAFAGLVDDDERVFQAAKTAALALKDAGRPTDARKLLEQVLDRVEDRDVAVSVLIEGAYLALEGGELDQAEAQVQVASRRSPRHPQVAEASFFVAEARFEAGDDARAIKLYEAAVGAPESPVLAPALYKLGFAELRAGDAKAAEGYLLRVVEQHPESELWGEALFLLGETRYRLGEFGEAAGALERLRKERPRHEVMPKALFRLGLCYRELERWSECESVLAALVKANPKFENLAEAELARGTALVALGRERAAKQALARVLAIDGESVLAARAHIQLGRLAKSDGDLEGALAEFLKVAVLFAAEDEVAESLVLAGECLEEQGKHETAIARYREVVERYGKTEHAAQARARLRELERSARR